MSRERISGERMVTISFQATGLEAAHLEDAIDDYYEANEAWERFDEWVGKGGTAPDASVRLDFFSTYLGRLTGAALAQQRLKCIIEKVEEEQ